MINKVYLEPRILKKLSEGFGDNNPKGVQLTSFMDKDFYALFLRGISNANFIKKDVRDMHSFFEAKNTKLNSFSTREFLSFCSVLSGKKIKKAECSLRMFMKGCYTLIHEETAKKGIEFFFDLTPKWNEKFGGQITYLAYDGSKGITPQYPNNLILAESGRSYVKYVNSFAGSEGRLIVYGRLE